MEHPFFPTTTTRAEALRWLTIAEKLLSKRDLMGSKSFATRARDSDPTLSPADQILAVADTLLAGERRIGNSHHDWYAILRLTPPQGRDAELVATQYRNLAVALNPQKNKFAFADEAFRLVIDAWSVLSNPSRKSQYDKELNYYLNLNPQQQQQQQQQQSDPFTNPIPPLQQSFMFFGGGSSGGVTHSPQSQGVAAPFPQVQVHAHPQVDPVGGGSTGGAQSFINFASGSNLVFGSGSGSKSSQENVSKHTQGSYPPFPGNVTAPPGFSPEQLNSKTQQSQQDYSNENVNVEEEEDMERVDAPAEDGGATIWTACPYCYYMYEYPGIYTDCTLRCQNCKKAFQAVAIPSPPPVVDGQNGYFCCWAFFPLGFSKENWEKNRGAAASWTPFSPMFTCPQGQTGNPVTKRGPRKNSGPRVYIDDDEVYVEVSESSSSDDDWDKSKEKKKKKAKNVKGKGASGTTPNRSAKKAQVDTKGKNVGVQDAFVSPGVVEASPNKTGPGGESSKKGANVNARKQPGRVAKSYGKLDLNVEFSNSEAEEPSQVAPAHRANQGNGGNRGEDDNIEGIGFFEGLDEFLSSLPILNVVGDDKVVKAA